MNINEMIDQSLEAQRLLEEYNESVKEVDTTAIVKTRNFNFVDWKYEKIKEQIEEFQSDLSEDTDVCVSLASFGTSMIMQVEDIGYQNPDLLYFYGYINGNKAQLIQHASQLNFALIAVKKEDTTRPPRRIGFVSD